MLNRIVAKANPIMFMDPWGLCSKKNSFGVSFSFSQSFLGKGTTRDTSGFERPTYSAFDLGGASFDISIGNQPSRDQDVVSEIGIGLGKYLGVGFYFYGTDAFGNPEYGGITVHVGVGVGTPAYVSGSMDDDSRVRSW